MTAPRTPSTRRPTVTASTWMALAFVAVFAYFDWITHRELPLTIVLALLIAAVIVYRRAIVAALNLGETFAAIPARVKAILAAIPGFAYFLIRGQGTSGAGGVVFAAMLVVVLTGALFGPNLDRALVPYYRGRNRVAPKPVRMALAIVLPVLVAFLVIHGSLSDLPAMFGGKTKHPQSPVGRDGYFFLGTLLSAVIAWLLLRDAPARAPAPAPAAVPAPSAPVAPAIAAAPAGAPAVAATAWQPTHLVPAGGLTAWAEPYPTAPSMQVAAGLGVQLVIRSGDWAQVSAQNGWTGWVDARALVPVAGAR